MVDEKTGCRIPELKRNDFKPKTIIEMLDLILKVSTLSFLILCGFGFYIISKYLSSNGLLRESFSYMTSFNNLFSIAIFLSLLQFLFLCFLYLFLLL